jgi:hypothetical protein
MLNGQMRWVAVDNTERTTADCYWSDDGGTTARSSSGVLSTSVLYWNAVVTGKNLVNGSDFIDLLYY